MPTETRVPLPPVLRNLPLPVVGAPLFIVSNPRLVIEQCETGVLGNYLKASIRAAGMDPDNLPESDLAKMNFGNARKAWKDIWGCGQGIGAVKAVISTRELVARLKREYEAARRPVGVAA